MRARLVTGGRAMEIVDGREPDWRAAAPAVTPSAARALLGPHVVHPVLGRELRELLGRVDGAATVWRLRDGQVLDSLVWRLFCGDLRIVTAETLARTAALPPIPDSVPGTAEQAPPTSRPAFREAPPPPPPTEPPPDELAHLEQDVQAAALEEAAEQGTPFCEECDERRRELAGAGT